MSITPTLDAQHPVHGQHSNQSGAAISFGLIGVVTHVTPAYRGESATEAYLTQPMIMLHATALAGRLRFAGELNFERWTLGNGELNPGIAGEGFVDRRHPHTYFHEAVVTYVHTFRSAGFSLTAGKGFVPFGSDDPMVRPFVKYPANHHLAQILERAVVVAAVNWRRVAMEAALFNGDEPTSAASFPNLRRFGDSRAARVTFTPRTETELGISYAVVASPEIRNGGGLTHRKLSGTARWQDRDRYALLEWARTNEYDGTYRAFTFSTGLAEIAASVNEWQLAVRAEHTSRPEEERTADPFRTPVPHADDNIIGATRWTAFSLRAERMLDRKALRFRPFLEVQVLKAEALLSPTLFVPAEFYGSNRMWSISVGLQVGGGTEHTRAGRYGAAQNR